MVRSTETPITNNGLQRLLPGLVLELLFSLGTPGGIRRHVCANYAVVLNNAFYNPIVPLGGHLEDGRGVLR